MIFLRSISTNNNVEYIVIYLIHKASVEIFRPMKMVLQRININIQN